MVTHWDNGTVFWRCSYEYCDVEEASSSLVPGWNWNTSHWHWKVQLWVVNNLRNSTEARVTPPHEFFTQRTGSKCPSRPSWSSEPFSKLEFNEILLSLSENRIQIFKFLVHVFQELLIANIVATLYTNIIVETRKVKEKNYLHVKFPKMQQKRIYSSTIDL